MVGAKYGFGRGFWRNPVFCAATGLYFFAAAVVSAVNGDFITSGGVAE